MPVTVDLSQETEAILEEAARLLDEEVMPWLIAELKATWPRRTGESAEAWRYDGARLVNDVNYTEDIRRPDGLAVDTVLQPLLTQAAQRAWTT